MPAPLAATVRRRMLLMALLLLVRAPVCADGTPTPPADLPSIAARTAGLTRIEGFLPLYWSAADGHLFLEIPQAGLELLYVTTLTQGLGSNDVGLDRGQVSEARLVRFDRIGPKVLLVQPNLAFRAAGAGPEERLAVAQSFADSVLFGFKLEAVEGDRLLVDATPFALRDGHDAIGALKRAEQGSFTLDTDRSALFLPGTKAFPRNTEIEVTLTLKGDAPGKFVKDVAPIPEAISLRERYSLIALPEPGYVPRRAEAGDGYFELNYADYAVSLGQPLQQHLIVRHRLQKKDPQAAVSEPVQPIVYYLDRGAPPPIREALLAGARWWNEAFEAAGYREAFRVELLPEDADPMDIRFNTIQWVHRATRGWSYGAAVVDPRTGEIIKGNITLGSLRARYDYLIAEGLLSPYGDDPAQVSPRIQQLVLSRLSQLAAHELGHTLGLAHNYIASAQGRSSVMDYPQPLVVLKPDGSLDLSQAYAAGIGAWDKVAIDFGYREFPAGTDEPAALNEILVAARRRGLSFLTDEDARPAGAAHPDVSLWDNGADAAAELRRMMGVRRAALDRFGEGAIRQGLPLATLEEVLVPLYLDHRYQVEATAKALGGERYTVALKGDGQTPVQAVPAAEQLRALSALLETLSPAELALPEALLDRIPPRPSTWPATRELFARNTAPSFDALSPAVAAAGITLAALLQADRDTRLIEQHDRNPALPGLETLLDALEQATTARPTDTGMAAEIRRAEQDLFVDRLMDLAAGASMPQLRAVAAYRLEGLRKATPSSTADAAERAHRFRVAADIARFQAHPEIHAVHAAPTPPGSPLGDEE